MGVGKVVGDTLFNFGDQTSIAGLSNVCHRKTVGKKIYWAVLFTLFLAATILGVWDNITAFFSFLTITSTDLSHKSSIIFPAVSVCNLNK